MLQPALRVWLATSLLFPIHDSLSAQTRPLAARGTFSTAPRIGGREFFERVGAVQLSVRTGPAILENTTRERLAAVARDALAARGIRVVERARVRAVVDVETDRAKLIRTTERSDGTVIAERSVYVWTNHVDVQFQVDAPVLQGSRFARQTVAPFANWEMWTALDPSQQDKFDDDFRQSLDDVLTKIAETSPGPPSAADRAAVQGLDAAYERASAAVTTVPGVNLARAVDLRISLLGEAARHVDAADLRSAWTRALTAAGATAQSGAGQELLVEVGVTRGQTIGMLYYPIVGHVRLREYDTVFDLDGALVRSNACMSSFGFSATGIDTTKAADLDQLTGDLLDSFVLRVSATR